MLQQWLTLLDMAVAIQATHTKAPTIAASRAKKIWWCISRLPLGVLAAMRLTTHMFTL
jgi:hypothetical protein